MRSLKKSKYNLEFFPIPNKIDEPCHVEKISICCILDKNVDFLYLFDSLRFILWLNVNDFLNTCSRSFYCYLDGQFSADNVIKLSNLRQFQKNIKKKYNLFFFVRTFILFHTHKKKEKVFN